MKIKNPGRTSALAVTALAAALLATPADAIELYNQNGDELHFDGLGIFGAFRSQRSYNLGAKTGPGSSSWREGFINYGFTGSKALPDEASLYGRISLVSSGTWGDGDAGGFTSGNERRTAIEDAYLGWRSGALVPALGQDGIDFSFGRQRVVIGDGFLINGDALNLGDAIDRIAGTDLDRGGAYWLAARKAFDGTAVLRLGGAEGLRSDIFWLKSDNKAQAKMELAGINVEHVSELGTLGAMYLEGLGVDRKLGGTHRDGQKTWNLRAQGNAGVENLFLSGEYARQRQGDRTARNADAWYLEAGWTFGATPWEPRVSYRYSTFDEDFDPLFFGFNRGYGTWFQGEVAANFAGPFNSDADVHLIQLGLAPSETLSIGANYFDFRRASVGPFDVRARELNVYAQWVVHDNLIISPLVGFYKPKKSEAEGGTQFGSNKTNTYMHVLMVVPF